MAVYVDPAVWPFGNMVMCHMWADTIEELFDMADKIGVQRKWLQRPEDVPLPGMKASWVHFDIAKSKRALAVRHGAVETDRYGAIYWLSAREGNTAKMDAIDALRKSHQDD